MSAQRKPKMLTECVGANVWRTVLGGRITKKRERHRWTAADTRWLAGVFAHDIAYDYPTAPERAVLRVAREAAAHWPPPVWWNNLDNRWAIGGNYRHRVRRAVRACYRALLAAAKAAQP